MSNNNSDLKNHIESQLVLVESEDGSIDIAEVTRKWLEQQGILQIVVDAIRGEAKDAKGKKLAASEQLSTRDRVNAALKLSNKILPDLKSSEQKTNITIDQNVRHTATHDLLMDAGCIDEPIDIIPTYEKEKVDD